MFYNNSKLFTDIGLVKHNLDCLTSTAAVDNNNNNNTEKQYKMLLIRSKVLSWKSKKNANKSSTFVYYGSTDNHPVILMSLYCSCSTQQQQSQ